MDEQKLKAFLLKAASLREQLASLEADISNHLTQKSSKASPTNGAKKPRKAK